MLNHHESLLATRGCKRTYARQGARVRCGGLILRDVSCRPMERVHVPQNGPTGSRHLGGGVGVCVLSSSHRKTQKHMGGILNAREPA